MQKTYTVTLDKIIADAGLEEVYLPKPAEEISVSSSDVNRPGLPLAGYMEYFDDSRIQILGNTEYGFLKCDADTRTDIRSLLGTVIRSASSASHSEEVSEDVSEA